VVVLLFTLEQVMAFVDAVEQLILMRAVQNFQKKSL
jgi:hypothetical protein